MSRAEAITLIIAGYGAVLSSITMVRQIIAGRVRLKLRVDRDMLLSGDPRYSGMTLVILKVINVGHRPITITHTGAKCLYPTNPFMLTDNQPALAREIKEGEYIVSILNQNDADLPSVDYWQVIDSRGKIHKLREASWFAHLKSQLKWKRAARSARS